MRTSMASRTRLQCCTKNCLFSDAPPNLRCPRTSVTLVEMLLADKFREILALLWLVFVTVQIALVGGQQGSYYMTGQTDSVQTIKSMQSRTLSYRI